MSIFIVPEMKLVNININAGKIFRFFFIKNGVIRHAGDRQIVTAEVLKDTFDVDVRIREIDGQTVVLNGLG